MLVLFLKPPFIVVEKSEEENRKGEDVPYTHTKYCKEVKVGSSQFYWLISLINRI